jgi:23S rRNA pseudouridine1911/1915/1917 synthase|tara:strand:+ start:163 stop:837 length:675 start_codon:yes stop_codon:yes gene_type:complete
LSDLSVIYEDNHILVVNKAAGLLVQGDQTGDESLVDIAKRYIKDKYQKPGNVFLGLVHRLDRPTTGVIVLARTSKALTRLNQQFKDRLTKKVYRAVVSGSPEPKARLEHFLRKNSSQNKSFHYPKNTLNTKHAILRYRYIEQLRSYHVLEIELETGRHHQIRVQLAAVGLHIKGDLKYGAKRPNQNGSIHLHAQSLALAHPTTKEEMKFIAPYPDDVIWNSLTH